MASSPDSSLRLASSEVIKPPKSRTNQHQKYRHRKSARKAAERDVVQEDTDPSSQQSKTETNGTSTSVSSILATADVRLPSSIAVKSQSAVGEDAPHGPAINTKTTDTDASNHNRGKKARGWGRKKVRKPYKGAQEDEKLGDSTPVHLPTPSALQHEEEETDNKTNDKIDVEAGGGKSPVSAPSSEKIVRSGPGSPTSPCSTLAPVSVSSTVLTTQAIPPNGVPASEIQASSQHSVVVEQALDNLYTMIRQQRELLFQGPLITIYTGVRTVTGIYKRVAMATSPVLNKYFIEHPESDDFSVQDYVAPEAVEYMLVTWMNEIRHDFEVFAMPLQPTFSNNVAILRAVRFLGMEPYTKWILTKHVEYLRENIPTYEEVTLVEHNRASDHDPIWTFMINHLCHVRHHDLIPDPEDFANFLVKHPALSAAMRSADEYFAARAEKARRERWEQNEVERLERVAREQKVVASLSRKMEDRSGSRLMMVSDAEAALLRTR